MVKNIRIVSLSSGILGEQFVKHELEIGLNRLKEMGVEVSFGENSLKGLEFIKNNPKARADDLLNAFKDESVDMILCAIGGIDTYKLLPYLFDNDELKSVINQKIFLGFSDTTVNHFMLNKLGIYSFYGQAFLPDVCELSDQMLPYSYSYFKQLIDKERIEQIRPSDIWYKEREDFSAKAIGTSMREYKNNGFELLQGSSVFTGKILGGCIDTIYDFFDSSRHSDSVELINKYNLFPEREQWKNKILLLETSEEKPTVEKYRKGLEFLKEAGVFENINGILMGKPQDEINFDEYKKVIVEVVDNVNLPIVANINIGHATPRCIMPFNVDAKVDVDNQVITFSYE